MRQNSIIDKFAKTNRESSREIAENLNACDNQRCGYSMVKSNLERS